MIQMLPTKEITLLEGVLEVVVLCGDSLSNFVIM